MQMTIKMLRLHVVVGMALWAVCGCGRPDRPAGKAMPVLDRSTANMETLSKQAGIVAAWLRTHLKDVKWKIAMNGNGRIGVTGTVRGQGPNIDDCSFGFELDGAGGFLVCMGALSKTVPEARLEDVQALLSRFKSRRNVFIAAFALGNDRRVRCCATFPLSALRADPRGAVRRLSTNVLPDLLELSDAVTRVCRDGQRPEEALDSASFPRGVAQALKDPDSDDDSWDATSEEEKVIESWFDVLGVKYERGIETELTVYIRDQGNAGQELQDCFVMCGDVVLSQCRLNLTIPENRRKALMNFVLAYNATQPVVTLHMGYVADPADSIYFQYLMPVSVLRAEKDDPVAKEHFNSMLDTAHLVAVEMSAHIRRIVDNVHNQR